ncbi:hypothetical protein [Algoriphagus sp. NG3]|uniref:hypothetical protein n=1 Tax=Algoriphagus sp. NG3 TaxID=3097546 RepID=UPI002A833FCA|nr:hypothetical protein [Algoriphagus sp. NG3]WPR77683.1 hypothetical protein SLW71_10040 [Algoriphagus sp. NG3]
MANLQDKTVPISYEKAAELISNLKDLKGHPVVDKNAGGTFEAEKIIDWIFQDTFSGLMCWYCLDGADFFIAIEPCFNHTYDENYMKDKRPAQAELLIPKNKIKENLFADGDLSTKLSSYTHDVSGKQETAPNYKVSCWVEEYINSGNCVSPFSYFIDCENSIKVLKDFIEKKGPKNIRYFFSYDLKHGNFPLRVILAPVNDSGQNIKKLAGKDNAQEDVLQYSWPPKTDEDTSGDQ